MYVKNIDHCQIHSVWDWWDADEYMHFIGVVMFFLKIVFFFLFVLMEFLLMFFLYKTLYGN